MHRGRTVLAMDCVLAGAQGHRARPLNSVVSHHVDAASKRTILRVIAAIVGTIFLVAFLITWFAFPDAKSGIIQILGLGVLMAYGYALFPALSPGQSRWDELDAEIEAKSRRAETPTIKDRDG